MQHLLLVDETFDLNFTQEYHLSIQFSLDGFSFCVRDGLQNKYIYLFHKEFSGNPKFTHRKLEDIYSEFDILNAPFKTTQLLYSSPEKMVLIPEQFFDGASETENNQLNLSLAADEELIHIPVHSCHSVLEIAIQKKIKRFFEEKHPGTIIQHEIINHLNADSITKDSSSSMSIHLYKDQMIISFWNGSLRFLNSFKYQNENDLLYYILNVVKTENWQDNIKIQLNGRVNKRSPIYHSLRQYFKHVVIQTRRTDVYYSYLFDQLPDARFVNLLNNRS